MSSSPQKQRINDLSAVKEEVHLQAHENNFETEDITESIIEKDHEEQETQ